MKKNIFQRDIEGEMIESNDPDFLLIVKEIKKTQTLLKKLNYTDLDEEQSMNLFSKIINKPIPEGFWFLTPIYMDYGKNLNIGKNVFINFGNSFLDRGSITLEDNVMIGPNCNLMTTNHPIDPKIRKNNISKPIHLKENVWLGANVTIYPGVTIGKNSIIAGGSVVHKDVPDNVVYGGNPAKFIKKIDFNNI